MNSQILQQFAQNMMNNNRALQNPMMNNAINMYKNHNSQGLTELAQNICQSSGMTYEEAKKQALQRLGIN